MDKYQELINNVMEQLKNDVQCRDMTAIEKLLYALPAQKLVEFLPEEIGMAYRNEYTGEVQF